jgi:hypothetical protein
MVFVGYTALGVLGACAVLIPVVLLLRQRRTTASVADEARADLPAA